MYSSVSMRIKRTGSLLMSFTFFGRVFEGFQNHMSFGVMPSRSSHIGHNPFLGLSKRKGYRTKHLLQGASLFSFITVFTPCNPKSNNKQNPKPKRRHLITQPMAVETPPTFTTRTRNIPCICAIEVQRTQKLFEFLFINGVCKVIIVKEK